VDVSNPSFEEPPVAASDYRYEAPPWILGEPSACGIGVWRPYPLESYYSTPIPDGRQVAFIGDASYCTGSMHQLLEETIRAGVTYDLEVDVAWRNDFPPTAPQYRISLFDAEAGTVLASYEATAATRGAWSTAAVSSVAAADGGRIGIRLELLAGGVINFDNVRLDAWAIPDRCDAKCEGLWGIRWFQCPPYAPNYCPLQRDGSPLCGTVNCPGPDCWDPPVVAAHNDSGHITWHTGPAGALDLHHDRNFNVYAWTWLYSVAGHELDVPVEHAAANFWLNDVQGVPAGGMLHLSLGPGWNRLECTSCQQDDGARLRLDFPFLWLIDCMAPAIPTVALTMRVEPEEAGQTNPAAGGAAHAIPCGVEQAIQAVPSTPRWLFDHWEGPVLGAPEDPENTVRLEMASTVTAVFVEDQTALAKLSIATTGSLARVLLSNPTATIAAGSLGISYDASQVSCDDVQLGSALAALHGGAGPDFKNLVCTPDTSACPDVTGGLALQWLCDFSSNVDEMLPPVAEPAFHELFVVRFSCEEQVVGETQSALCLIDCLRLEDADVKIVLASDAGMPIDVELGECATVQLLCQVFKRGDANATQDNRSGQVDIADAVFLLSYLFARGAAPLCMPPAPYPGCGQDLTQDELRCDEHPPCE
jgi:hypothetical protein